MARIHTIKYSPRTIPIRRKKSRAIWGHLASALLLIGGLIAITIIARRYVDQQVAAPSGPLKVVIKDKPVWMSDFLAEQIAATVPRTASSSFDRDLLVAATEKLRQNPWVCDVRQVRRVYGDRPGDTLEIDCDFRAPIALVQWGQFYWLVDGEGVKLPEQFAASHVPRIVIGRDGRINIRLVQGVREAPPETGKKWLGRDVAAAVAMAKLLCGQACAEQIAMVDVTNFAGREDAKEAQIVLRTKFGTEVRWGRPLDSADYFDEVPAGQKLSELADVMRRYGRVDGGHPWIDIRYDRITFPTPTAAVTAARADGG